MTCGTCKYHLHDENNTQDKRMSELGWKLCAKSDDQMKNARYFHENHEACVKYNKRVALNGKL